jgi:hypothetical protein
MQCSTTGAFVPLIPQMLRSGPRQAALGQERGDMLDEQLSSPVYRPAEAAVHDFMAIN